ncbi:MAG: hypothetical protein ACRC4M_04950 [Mycoplasma sp.]
MLDLFDFEQKTIKRYTLTKYSLGKMQIENGIQIRENVITKEKEKIYGYYIKIEDIVDNVKSRTFLPNYVWVKKQWLSFSLLLKILEDVEIVLKYNKEDDYGNWDIIEYIKEPINWKNPEENEKDIKINNNNSKNIKTGRE